MDRQQMLSQSWIHYVMAFLLVALASVARIWPLHVIGSSLAWLTYYPAVMVVAIYGGLYAGLLATILSCLTVTFLWQLLVATPFIKVPGDYLGMLVFCITGSLISGVAEAMRRAQSVAITERKKAEAANLAKSVFLSTMSHELRTPLNAILGFSSLMQSDPALTESQRENLDIINRSGGHLLNLINDVLDMAKIEAGRVELDIKPFDLGILVRDITDMLSKRAEEKGLQLLLDQSSEFPRFIKSDKDKLRQVIVNLVGNAIKFTNRGRIMLRLGIQPSSEESQLVIEVEDTGIGISENDRMRIFDPFVQVGKPATQKGTGLGLSIVREYVKLMGGEITVTSTPDVGSQFRVTLPILRAEESDVLVSETLNEKVIGLVPGQPEYRVLIVEDQLENQLLLNRLLTDAGFTVKLAHNGEEGIALFQSYHPHFIWMDRRMPVMDGLEATRRIRALAGGIEVKIAAVTASAFADQRAEMLAAGMDDFVRKPYRPTEIFECMSRLLGVRFVHEKAVDSVSDSTISTTLLLTLNASQRKELNDALVLGNTEQINNLIILIEQQHSELAEKLRHYASTYNYLPILNGLESVETQIKETKP